MGLTKVCDELIMAIDEDETKELLDAVVEMAKNWTPAEWDQNWKKVQDETLHLDLFEAAKARVPVPQE